MKRIANRTTARRLLGQKRIGRNSWARELTHAKIRRQY
jgi:hypothetical protein